MSKTINPEEQFEEHVLTVFCDCFSKDHYLVITRADKLFEFAVIDNYQPDLWERVKRCLQYLRTGPWVDQVIVNEENTQKLVKVLVNELKKRKRKQEEPGNDTKRSSK